jgi:hypothetical protein
MLCPLCNGFGSEPDSCNACGGKVTECGRTSDWTGPYEPYAPIAESLRNVLSNGDEAGLCCHVVYCDNCRRVSEVMIAEWPNGQ